MKKTLFQSSPEQKRKIQELIDATENDPAKKQQISNIVDSYQKLLKLLQDPKITNQEIQEFVRGTLPMLSFLQEKK